MNYHQPDARWAEVYNIKDFAKYEFILVVKGKFHPLVPKDVVEAYLQAEYMMAFAYYHYSLYDEALSKILRVFEMAIRLKCTSLGIELKKKTLSELMGLVHKNGPAKDLGTHFNAIRSLRNHFMHPKQYNYAGPINHEYVVRCVSLLNMIFIPEQIFIDAKAETERMKEKFKDLEERLSILTTGDGRFLIYSVSIRASLFINGRWIYVLYSLPIAENTVESLTKHAYLKPFCFIVDDIFFKNNNVVARIAGTNEVIVLQANTKAENEIKYTDANSAIQNLDENLVYMYRMNNEVEIDKTENKFLLEYLYKVNTDNAS